MSPEGLTAHTGWLGGQSAALLIFPRFQSAKNMWQATASAFIAFKASLEMFFDLRTILSETGLFLWSVVLTSVARKNKRSNKNKRSLIKDQKDLT